MKTAVAQSSIRVYRSLSAGDLSRSEALIVEAMKPRLKYTRRELEALSGLRSGSVCGRVADLLVGGILKASGTKTCSQSGKEVEALMLVERQVELELN